MRVLIPSALVVLSLVLAGGCAPGAEDRGSVPEAPTVAAEQPAVAPATEPRTDAQPASQSQPAAESRPTDGPKGSPQTSPPAAPPGESPSVPDAPAQEATRPVAAEPETPAEPDALQLMVEEQRSQAERSQSLARAQEQVDAAQAKVDALEKQLLPVSNPFLPRPQLSEAEAKAREGLSGPEQLKRVQDQIAAARLELEAARKVQSELGGGKR